MQSIAITHLGLESVAEKEIKELISPAQKSISTEESVVIFEPKDLIDLCTLCYRAQSLIKVILLKKKLVFDKTEDIFNAAKNIDFSDFITKKATFKVQCSRIGEHDFSSSEIEEGVGHNINGNVDLDSPDVIVCVYIYNKNCYIGIDFSGFDLSKRQYRIFTYKDQLRATVAYAMLRIANYKPGDFLLDPFCGTGTILIEAALFACNFSGSYFMKDKFAFLKFGCFRKTDFDKFFSEMDKKIDQKSKLNIYGYDALLGYVKGGQKNAKIAGINKSINISRADIDWLDTKVDKNKVDKIVSYPPQLTERNQKGIEKLYKEFFHQADFVLKKKGAIALASESEQTKDLLKKYASEYKFRVKSDFRLMQGKKELGIILFQR